MKIKFTDGGHINSALMGCCPIYNFTSSKLTFFYMKAIYTEDFDFMDTSSSGFRKV